MTDYTNFDDIMKLSTNIGGLDEIHGHILDLTKEIEGHKKGLSKEELDETAKVICNLLDTSKKLKEENEKLKEDARTNLDYSLKYEKEGVKKDEEISQLKKEIEELKKENGEIMDSLDTAIENRDNEENEELKNKIKKLDDELTQAHVDWKEEGERRLFENINLKKENEKLKETLTKVDSLVSPVLFG